jgi:hypothetical protein
MWRALCKLDNRGLRVFPTFAARRIRHYRHLASAGYNFICLVAGRALSVGILAQVYIIRYTRASSL